MTTPDLLMIPSGYKGGKVYLQKPVDGDGDLTLTRATVKNRVQENGLIESVVSGMPTLEWLNVSCPSLSVEPAATNLVTDSEDIDTYFGTKTAVSVTDNSTMSPDGTQTADQIIENTSTVPHLVAAVKNGLVDTTSEYILTIFLKQNGRNRVKIKEGDSSEEGIFDLEAGTVLSGSKATIENYGNGWYRCAVQFTTVNTDFTPSIQLLSDSGATSYNGNGVNGCWAWGVDLVKKNHVTSYIKTSSGSATRNQDVLNSPTDATMFNEKEGVFMVEIASFTNLQKASRVGISDGSTNNRVDIGYNSTSQEIESIIAVGGVTQATLSFAVSDVTAFNKVAVKYKLNDFAMWIGGTERATDSSGVTFDSGDLDRFLSDEGGGSNDFEGKIKRIEYYKTALSDADLALITT